MSEDSGQVTGIPDRQVGPILVFGMPRSGTTWLGKILDSDPGTLYRHEPDSYGRMNFLPAAPAHVAAIDHAPAIREFYAGLPYVRDTKVAARAPYFRKRFLGPVANSWNAVAGLGAKLASRVAGEVRVPLWFPERALGRARLVTKSIESVARVGVVARAVPEARIVLILRSPYGFVASMIRGKHGRQFVDSDSIGEDIRLLGFLCDSDIGQRYGIDTATLRHASPIQRLAWQWVLTNDKALIDTEGMGNVTTLRYEDLCRDPLGETERLFAWSGLEVTDQTRRFLNASTSVHRSRYYSIFKSPDRAANAWREELDEDTRAAVRGIAKDSRAGMLYQGDL